MAKAVALLKVLREGIEDVVDAFAAKQTPVFGGD